MNAVTTFDRIPAPHGMAHRFVSVGIEQGADGVLLASLSSETPYWRDFASAEEILVHTPEAVDLSRAAMGLPLLIDHDPERQLGRVENIRLKGRKLVGEIRLSERADLAGIVADVRAGIRPDVSVGYFVDSVEWAGDRSTYLVTRWTLYEVSSVAMPADHTVGIGRALVPNSSKEIEMNALTTGAPALSSATSAAPHSVPATAERGESHAVRAERDRVTNIRTLAGRLNCTELGERAIREGHDIDTFTAIYSERTGSPSVRYAEGPAPDAQFDREVRQFSVSAAIAGALNGRLVGREAEVRIGVQ